MCCVPNTRYLLHVLYTVYFVCCVLNTRYLLHVSCTEYQCRRFICIIFVYISSYTQDSTSFSQFTHYIRVNTTKNTSRRRQSPYTFIKLSIHLLGITRSLHCKYSTIFHPPQLHNNRLHRQCTSTKAHHSAFTPSFHTPHMLPSLSREEVSRPRSNETHNVPCHTTAGLCRHLSSRCRLTWPVMPTVLRTAHLVSCMHSNKVHEVQNLNTWGYGMKVTTHEMAALGQMSKYRAVSKHSWPVSQIIVFSPSFLSKQL